MYKVKSNTSSSFLIEALDLLKIMTNSGLCWESIAECGNISDFSPLWIALMVGGEGYKYRIGDGYIIITTPDELFRWIVPFDISYDSYLRALENNLDYYGRLDFIPRKACPEMVNGRVILTDREFVLDTTTLRNPSGRRVREYIKHYSRKAAILDYHDTRPEQLIRCIDNWAENRRHNMPKHGLWDLNSLRHLVDNYKAYEDIVPVKLLAVEMNGEIIGIIVGTKLSTNTWTVLYRKGLRGNNGIDEFLWGAVAKEFDEPYENDGGASGMMALHKFKQKYLKPGGYLQNIYSISLY